MTTGKKRKTEVLSDSSEAQKCAEPSVRETGVAGDRNGSDTVLLKSGNSDKPIRCADKHRIS